MSRSILTVDMIHKKKYNLNKKGVEQLVPVHRIFNNLVVSKHYFCILK